MMYHHQHGGTDVYDNCCLPRKGKFIKRIPKPIEHTHERPSINDLEVGSIYECFCGTWMKLIRGASVLYGASPNAWCPMSDTEKRVLIRDGMELE